MKTHIKIGLAALSFGMLGACGQVEIPTSVFARTTPLPDGTITLEGESYVLKRATATSGRKAGQEVWAIVVDGKPYSCRAANDVSCQAALNRAKAGERIEEDMGGGY